MIVNRVHHDLLGDAEPGDVRAALGSGLGDDLAERVAENFADYHLLARRDRLGVERLRSHLDGEPLLLVPHMDNDVHDMEGLLRMHRYLFASEREREQLIAGVVA